MFDKVILPAAFIVAAASALEITPDQQGLHRMFSTVIDGRETIASCYPQQDGVSFFCTQEPDLKHSKLTLSPSETKKDKIIAIAISVMLTLFGGLMSGLTVGLASIDRLALEIEAKGNE